MAVQNQPAGLLAAEGLFSYFCERLPSLLSFSAEYCSRIVLAEVKKGPGAGSYVLWNVHTTIFIYNSGLNERDPVRRIELRYPVGPGTGTTASSLPSGYITTMSFTPDAADEYDLLVGFSNGEVRALSLAAQMSAAATNSRPISPLVFNAEGTLTPSRCVNVSWLPQSSGSVFISAHADGSVYLHQKIVGNSSDTRLLERTSTEPSLRQISATQQLFSASSDGTSGIAATAISPSGKYIALACRDGVLKILEIPSGTLVAGFKSYYGGLVCCSWSPDGKLIATGGEDDLVAVYNFEKKNIVAHLQGHSSWVSGVAFDPWAAPIVDSDSSLEGVRYRLASVGQDCQAILWEVGAGLLESTTVGSGGVSADAARGGGNVDDSTIGMDVDRLDVNGNNPYSTSSSSLYNVISAGAGGGGGGNSNNKLAPALPRSEMTFIEPLSQLKIHIEPLCDVMFEPNSMLVSSNDGSVKKFLRPQSGLRAERAGAASG